MSFIISVGGVAELRRSWSETRPEPVQIQKSEDLVQNPLTFQTRPKTPFPALGQNVAQQSISSVLWCLSPSDVHDQAGKRSQVLQFSVC